MHGHVFMFLWTAAKILSLPKKGKWISVLNFDRSDQKFFPYVFSLSFCLFSLFAFSFCCSQIIEGKLGKLALVAGGRATSALFENFQDVSIH